ncbi:MAG: hypothetical protein KDK36_06205, partial [Leptospiraceae bacterium]|nr:hypothetical protein [Leptospiraceae bacterium]
MSLSVYEYLSGFQIGADFWEFGLDKSFKELLKAIESTQGSLVLYSEEEAGYIEFSSMGYEDSDFYYEFLVRGKGNFEKLEASTKPMVFNRTGGFELFHKESILAIASRIYGTRMHGFIIVELKSDSSLSLISWTLGLFAYRLASITEKRKEKEVLGIATELSLPGKDELSEILISYTDDWVEKVKTGISKKVFSIFAETGSGRSRVVKYIHRLFELPGDIIFLNLVPNQISKLEKSISEWLRIAGSGFIIIENTHLLSNEQQKYFFEYFQKSNHPACFIFFISKNKFASEI